MIDRERIEYVLERNKDGFPVLSVDELDELCRVYLAWLDAPEGRAESKCDASCDWLEIELPERLCGPLNCKLVRIVEVK